MADSEWISRFASLLTIRYSPKGAIAQLGERVLCKHEVVGSIPSGSTRRGVRDPLGPIFWLRPHSFASSPAILPGQSRVLLHREEETCSDNCPGAREGVRSIVHQSVNGA